MSFSSLHSYPRAILHIDGDSFFAACEVAQNPRLRGKPVITGLERGIASAMTYEAKRKGVTRGMQLSEIRRVCPEAVILPSDYETYSLYSRRMYEIVRRYTPAVEEYSIDECFADLTGLRRSLRMPYPKMAATIKHDLYTELGMTFSIGLAPTKVLAKVASKWSKPDGLTCLPLRDAANYLRELPTEKVWGIGPNTSAFLRKHGIHTALQFIERDFSWIARNLAKPYQEIWRELSGELVYELDMEGKHTYQSISKTKTFTPPSRDRAFVFAQLSKNIENACIKARRHRLAARDIVFFLKTQDFRCRGLELKLSRATSLPGEITEALASCFDEVYRAGTLYRATGIVLMHLEDASQLQHDLFGSSVRAQKLRAIYEAVDKLRERHGKHTVFLGSSFAAITAPGHRGQRGTPASRKGALLKGETTRRRLSIPILGEVR